MSKIMGHPDLESQQGRDEANSGSPAEAIDVPVKISDTSNPFNGSTKSTETFHSGDSRLHGGCPTTTGGEGGTP